MSFISNLLVNGAVSLLVRLHRGCTLTIILATAATPLIAQHPLAVATSDTLTFTTSGTLTAAEIGDGVWWRPELDETSITQVMINLNEWKIPNLYVDVFRSGETLFPSAVFPQRTEAADRDWFGYIIAEAHKHNIRVHAWAQVLCWQDPDAESAPSHPLLAAHPGWMETADDEMGSEGKSSARLVSPGVPEVRTSLLALTQEICRYSVDGLNLDSVSYDPQVDTGYNLVVGESFKNLYGVNPLNLKPDLDDDSEWMAWVSFREDKLTSLVQLMADQARLAGEAADRRILLSVNVHPVYEETRGQNPAYQHWGQWVERGLVDATIPQCFSPDLPGLEKQLWQVRSVHMGTETACLPGLLLDESTTNSHPSLREQQRLLKSAGFKHNNIMDYKGLMLQKQSPDINHENAEEERGFWDFFRSRR